MSYLNQVDINGVLYNIENLTDGKNIVKLPDLKCDDTFIVRGEVVDNTDSAIRYLPLSANQGRVLKENIVNLEGRADVLEEQTAQLRTDVDSHTADKNNPHEITPAKIGAYSKSEIDVLLGVDGSDALKQMLKFKELTTTEYEALDKKEENTLYMLTDAYDMAYLPPYTNADNGKVLKLVNGNPMWVMP